MLSTVMLLGLTLVAAVTDVLRKKIYNWNTYSGILAALGLSAAGSSWLWADGAAGPRLSYWLGSPTFSDSAVGLLACGGLMIVCFLFFPGIGGGDVKLMAMVGTMLGWEKGLVALLWTFVLAACFGLIALVWQVGPVTTVSRVGRLFLSKLRLVWLPLSDEERKALKPPIFLAPSALAAVVIVRFELIEVLEKVLVR
jgi:leader peptidase (prepilin peptidase)/N-methyltransferase